MGWMDGLKLMGLGKIIEVDSWEIIELGGFS